MQARLARIPPLALCAASGAALVGAFEPIGLYWLAWLAPVPLIRWADHGSAHRRLALGFAFGLGLFGVGLAWLPGAAGAFLEIPSLQALAYTAAIVLYLSLFPAFAAWLAGYFPVGAGVRSLLVWPSLWALLESARAEALVGGLPWLTLGQSQLDGPLAGWAPLAGEFGLSFAAVGLSGLLALAWDRLRGGARRPAGALVSAAVLVLAGSSLLERVTWTEPREAPLRVALVTSAIGQAEKWDPAERQTIVDRFAQATEASLSGADLVVWPETAVPIYADELHRQMPRLLDRARAEGTALLLGLLERTLDGGEYNSALLLTSSGQAIYRKRHLVPFAERLPPVFSWISPWWHQRSDQRPGQHAEPLWLGATALVPAICWEVQFGRNVLAVLDDGPGVIVNLVNEGWTASEAARRRAVQAARLRALESGRPLVRVANGGYSLVVGADGKVERLFAAERAGSHSIEVRASAGRTPFAAAGAHVIPVVEVALLLGVMLAARRRGALALGKRSP